MSDEEHAFGVALQDLRFREDLGFGLFGATSPRQRPLRYPDFLIVGAQKAGTTWVHNNLNYHPNIWLAPAKELNYFNEVYAPSSDNWEREGRLTQAKAAREFLDNVSYLTARQTSKRLALEVVVEDAVSDEWYGRLFANAPAEDLCGEASPEYCVLPRGGVAHIASLNPSLRPIMILRDPIDRFWSHLRMAERSGQVVMTLDYLRDDFTWRTFGGRSNYPEMLRRWRACFGDERLILLNYDWIVSDPMHLLRTVTEGLGLRFDERFFPNARQVIGAGKELVVPEDIYELAKARMAHIYEELLELLPQMTKAWYTRHYAS